MCAWLTRFQKAVFLFTLVSSALFMNFLYIESGETKPRIQKEKAPQKAKRKKKAKLKKKAKHQKRKNNKTSKKRRPRKKKKKLKTKRQSYYVAKGETWSSVAKTLKVPLKKLKRWNKRLKKKKRLKRGQRLIFHGPFRKTEAIGRPNRGSLKNGIHLDPDGDGLGKGYAMSRQRPDLWGTPELIRLIKNCGRTYRRYFSRKYAPIPIGDLSSRYGGPLKLHKSHQNGRDVDVGFMRKKPLSKGYFKDTRPREMNLYAQWVVLKCFLDDSKTQMVFIERSRVKALRKYIKRIYKKRPARLKKYLAFFSGKYRIIRPDSIHKSHMHVRIHCPKDDRRCID